LIAIIASDITDETNESIVVNPRRTQANSPNIQRCLTMVTTVIGMFNTDTSKSAKARLRRKPFEIVRRAFLLVKTKNKLMFPRMETVQMKTRMAASMMVVAVGVILRQRPNPLKRMDEFTLFIIESVVF